jgi:pimeloyl-ACP methyl ester carboxylesterase
VQPADVEALMDHLGLDRFAVLGHSAGGLCKCTGIWHAGSKVARRPM